MLTIYDTLSRSKKVFTPIDEGKIRMYVCGMTVYDYCHLGHARVMVGFDVITRFMRATGYDVTYVRNVTDVEDKIIKRAAENGEEPSALTERFIEAMHEDEDRLGVLRPDQEPRATGHMQAIVDMVQVLMDKGYAYAASNGDVYYRVTKFEGYGKLSKKNLEELQAGARIEVGESKEDPRDFVLWKAAKAGEISWPSPWGDGRPGWHIECSAMSTCCLGDTFDIHGGGPDLVFPHHENEIAQTEAATGETYANNWMHCGAVRVDNEKMSKSLGNFFTIREILEKYHPETVRYFLLSSQYRSAINYSEDSLKIAKQALDRFYQSLRGFESIPVKPLAELGGSSEFVQRFIDAMNDDFNTPVALAAMFDLVRELNTAVAAKRDDVTTLVSDLKSLGAVLGVLQCEPEAFLQDAGASEMGAEEIEGLIAERVQAKLDKNYGRADEVRQLLLDSGVILEDSREGTSWRRA